MEQQKQDNVSRRNFLKKLGAGAIGIGALTISPASALDIRSNNLNFYGADNNKELEITDGGPINMNTEVAINSNVDMSSSNTMKLPTVDGNPSNPEEGDMWYDSSA